VQPISDEIVVAIQTSNELGRSTEREEEKDDDINPENRDVADPLVEIQWAHWAWS
jgi:hypothetical protein